MTGEMLNIRIIKIEINEEEQRAFLIFRKHQAKIERMIEGRVFDVRNGKAILSFDDNGELLDIDLQFKSYKRNKHLDKQKKVAIMKDGSS